MVLCAPCLASVLGPAALGAVGLTGLNAYSKKGGSGYETQEEYDQMMNDNLSRESSYDRKERDNNERKQMERDMYILGIKQQEMRKECSNLVRLLEKKGVSKEKAKEYANQMVNHKIYCDRGNLDACDYCQKEYLKNLVGKKGRSKTPLVPREALPKSKSKSKKKKSRFKTRNSQEMFKKAIRGSLKRKKSKSISRSKPSLRKTKSKTGGGKNSISRKYTYGWPTQSATLKIPADLLNSYFVPKMLQPEKVSLDKDITVFNHLKSQLPGANNEHMRKAYKDIFSNLDKEDGIKLFKETFPSSNKDPTNLELMIEDPIVERNEMITDMIQRIDFENKKSSIFEELSKPKRKSLKNKLQKVKRETDILLSFEAQLLEAQGELREKINFLHKFREVCFSKDWWKDPMCMRFDHQKVINEYQNDIVGLKEDIKNILTEIRYETKKGRGEN